MDIDDIKLIPEFMGIHVLEGVNEFAGGRKYYYYNNPELEDYDALPDYKGSWDDLMSVVDKIENLMCMKALPSFAGQPFSVEIGSYGVQITIDNGMTKAPFKRVAGKLTKLERTHKAVVEFIKWYNENK